MQYIIVILTKRSIYPQTKSRGHSHNFRIQDYFLIQQPEMSQKTSKKGSHCRLDKVAQGSNYRVHQAAE